jgi:hypothetical protein
MQLLHAHVHVLVFELLLCSPACLWQHTGCVYELIRGRFWGPFLSLFALFMCVCERLLVLLGLAWLLRRSKSDIESDLFRQEVRYFLMQGDTTLAQALLVDQRHWFGHIMVGLTKSWFDQIMMA